MLDIKMIRNDTEAVRAPSIAGARRPKPPWTRSWRSICGAANSWSRWKSSARLRNTVSQEIAPAKRAGTDADDKMAAMRRVGDEIKALEAAAQDGRGRARGGAAAGAQPGRPDRPRGRRRRLGRAAPLGRAAAVHLPAPGPPGPGTALDMIDMERGGKVGQPLRVPEGRPGPPAVRPGAVRPAEAHRPRASGRSIPPVLVRDEAMFGTGFFPTDMQQVYRLEADALNLVGTCEVPLAALHMDEILDEADLPVRYVGYSSCFRREAGAAGKDTRGIFRVHQFDKVEMFSFCHPTSPGRNTTSCAPSRKRCCRTWACPTGRSTSPPATWAPRPPRSTTWKPGSPPRSGTARSPPAPTAPTTRPAA